MSQTPLRTLGRSGIPVSAMGLGCWAIGGPYWNGDTPVGWSTVDDAESTRAIHHGLEMGITLFDTADLYGTGHSEHVLGAALLGRRDRVVIATKFGQVFEEGTGRAEGFDTSPDYIRRACEASLRRLQTDYIDLYQLHISLFNPDLAGDVRDTLETLVQAGKIRAYGWSTDDPARARVFAEGPHCAAVQVQMNVLDDAAAMMAVCAELNLAALNRGPLAMGLLTGKYSAASSLPDDDVRGAKAPTWMKYFRDGKPSPEWLAKLDAIRQVLTSGGRTLAQGALAWLWARSPHTLPIPGFKTVAQVEEDASALAFGPLTGEQMRQIDVLLERSA